MVFIWGWCISDMEHVFKCQWIVSYIEKYLRLIHCQNNSPLQVFHSHHFLVLWLVLLEVNTGSVCKGLYVICMSVWFANMRERERETVNSNTPVLYTKCCLSHTNAFLTSPVWFEYYPVILTGSILWRCCQHDFRLLFPFFLWHTLRLHSRATTVGFKSRQ